MRPIHEETEQENCQAELIVGRDQRLFTFLHLQRISGPVFGFENTGKKHLPRL
jgi:hypothetical protein